MKHSISIIITAHNNNKTLPCLLESIVEQSLRNIEVVIVDDNSLQPYDNIVSYFACKGLHILLIRSNEQIFTKEARLRGIEAASADIITFADADDILYSTTALETNIISFNHSGADLLHFSAININDKATIEVVPWLVPTCGEIRGEEIFAKFISWFAGFNVWGKLYRRDLWIKLVPTARFSPIQRYCEDMYLFYLYAFHARHYIGTNLIGYGYNYRPETNTQRALGRMLAINVLIDDFLPYLKQHDCPQVTLAKLLSELNSHIAMQAARVAEKVYTDARGIEAALTELLAQCPADQLIHLLMMANGIMADLLITCKKSFRKFARPTF